VEAGKIEKIDKQCMKKEINSISPVVEKIPVFFIRNFKDSLKLIFLGNGFYIFSVLMGLIISQLSLPITVYGVFFFCFIGISIFISVKYGLSYVNSHLFFSEDNIIVLFDDSEKIVFDLNNIEQFDIYINTPDIKWIFSITAHIKEKNNNKIKKIALYRYRGQNPYYSYLKLIEHLNRQGISFRSPLHKPGEPVYNNN
jgi:hypothetical protein